jgi:hypothetical protein
MITTVGSEARGLGGDPLQLADDELVAAMDAVEITDRDRARGQWLSQVVKSAD